MTYFLRNGASWRVTDEANIDLHQVLPAGNYVIKIDPFGNMYLEEIDSFVPLKKYYGDTLKNTDRIINTFLDREQSTGIMLNGEKGSGKTLLAKNISYECYAKGIPTIIINSPFSGDKFNQLLQDIQQPCIVLFDEFEKVYNREEQESILTLLDGVFPSKKLFILTCNDKWRVDFHMRNRPGRIFYMLDFTGLSQEFIAEYCEDNLNNKDYIKKVCNIASLFSEFNFDMLKALIEDMNRYNESPQETLAILNAKPEYEQSKMVYNIVLYVNGIEIDSERLYEKMYAGNPLGTNYIGIEYSAGEAYSKKSKKNAAGEKLLGDEVPSEGSVHFSQSDLHSVDGKEGKFVFVNEYGARLELTRSKEKKVDYYGLI